VDATVAVVTPSPAGPVEPLSLTRQEAADRADLVEVDRYDVALDLRGLFEGEILEATSTVAFRSHEPGASTFVDCTGEIRHATLNGVPLDPATAERGRLPLPDLHAENVLVVASAQSDTGTAHGIKRTVDPSDKLVYLWTSFEPDQARRAWANFDQPDLKAVHGFTVSAPESWTVLSNSRHTSVADLPDGGRLWTFADTPRLSTYVTVVNAGPFYELREQRGGFDLGLYCRQSLKAQLDRDAPELFLLTEQGLGWFGEKFGAPFGQDKYDQVFVPDMGGAMENWGCVTWGDGALLRGTPTYDQRRMVAEILLHEMAHMWFGDLVTMKWWDDLWLNEAFASWAACWAAVGATGFKDCWASYLAAGKLDGYRVDMGPASHPIRGDVPDVSQAMANFDAISYQKGQAVLRQLSAYAGEEAFVEGLRSYFRDHAWGNTRLEDLTGAVGAACGEDLTGWQKDWLDRPGTDTLTLTGSRDGWVLRADGPQSERPRAHRLDIGCYAVDGDDLRHVADVAVTTTGESTAVELPESDLRLVNDHDLTFAAVRPDPASLQLMLGRAGRLPDPLTRALAVATTYDMLVKGELSAEDTLTCILGVLETETVVGVAEPFLRLAGLVAGMYSPIDQIRERRRLVADRAAVLAHNPDLGAGALQSLAANAVLPEHFEQLDAAASDDLGLAWRVQATLAARDRYDADAVERLLERDPDPDAAVSALIVRASRNLTEAKEEAWHALYVEQSVPGGPTLGQMVGAFWRPEQRDVLLPFTDRYLEEIPALAGGGMLKVFGLVLGMFPRIGTQQFLDQASAMARADGTDPTIRAALLGGVDTLARQLRARGELA
jgi:aminopeptidase N